MQRFVSSRVSHARELNRKGIVMAFIHWQDNAAPREASDIERVLCVAAVITLAALPFALCAALTVWGS
jgi:hypothetical protein